MVVCPRTAHTALHEDPVTQVTRMEIHVEVILGHDDEQLAELKALDGLVLREDHSHEQAELL